MSTQPTNGLVPRLTAQLRRDESEVLHAYPDSEGFWTLGVGRLIDARKGGGISAAESAYLLANDIQECLDDLDRRLPWYRQLDVARQGVLVNMSFQLGIDGLCAFKNSLGHIQARRWQQAHDALLDSLWAKQTPERAKRLATQMLTGEWQ